MSDIQKFLWAFLGKRGDGRLALVLQTMSSNAENSEIQAILSELNLSYYPKKDKALEMCQRAKPDNIFFICRRLRACPSFRFP